MAIHSISSQKSSSGTVRTDRICASGHTTHRYVCHAPSLPTFYRSIPMAACPAFPWPHAQDLPHSLQPALCRLHLHQGGLQALCLLGDGCHARRLGGVQLSENCTDAGTLTQTCVLRLYAQTYTRIGTPVSSCTHNHPSSYSPHRAPCTCDSVGTTIKRTTPPLRDWTAATSIEGI